MEPWGGRLVSLVISGEQKKDLSRLAASLPSVLLSPRAMCDLELLATGGFSPLDRFMGKADYRRVLDDLRLAAGTLFPIPVTLPVPVPGPAREGAEIALRTPDNEILATMRVEEVYGWDLRDEARHIYGTDDPAHPGVAEIAGWPRFYASGPLTVLNLPKHYDFVELRHTPAELRSVLEEIGHRDVVAFNTGNPLHRAHEELTKRAADQIGGALLIHPVVGPTRPGDVEYHTRVRICRVVVAKYYDPRRTVLSLLPLAMRTAGPREAVWHAIISRNHGANHLIVGPDHAGPGLDSRGRPFYGRYDAQELAARFAGEMGVRVLPFQEMVYLPGEDRYEEAHRVARGATTASLSGTEVREQYLAHGRRLPDWFTRPETADILAETSPPAYRQGFCIWFTGLSASGKSTIANILAVLLQERGRHVTLLDGDVVRTHLSKGLGFGKEDRDTNIRRIGFVAAEIARHHGAVICAAVSPYEATRNECRQMVAAGHFVLVHVATPLEVCERRDPKGLYSRARRGEIHLVSGIDDPYEPPAAPDLTLSTLDGPPEEDARRVLSLLVARGFVRNR